jgi:hypothetical protein
MHFMIFRLDLDAFNDLSGRILSGDVDVLIRCSACNAARMCYPSSSRDDDMT